MASLCVTAQVPDPKLARAGLAPFSRAPRDGITATSASGFVVMHGGKPVVLAAAAAVYPLLPPHRRQLGSLAGTRHADLVPGAQLAAVLPDGCASSSTSGTNADCSSQEASNAVELRLVGVAELPGVRQALARLLAAPSSAGPGGWQLGWLLHQQGQAAAPEQLSQLPAEHPVQRQTQQRQRPALSASPPPPDMLAVASHIAVLHAATSAGAQSLRQVALPWPGAAAAAAAQPGQAATAVGAPFGALAPQHFTGFLTTGVVSAAVPPSGSSSSSSRPALVLADLRCSPGMEGGPVFAGRPADAPPASAAAGAAAQPAAQPLPLVGMLLPPLKAPSVHVEWAAVAHFAAVAAAAEAVLGPDASAADDNFGTGSLSGSSMGSSSSSTLATPSQPSQPGASAAAAAALRGVVAVAVGGSWASGVLVSDAGHVLTNAHLLQPAAATPSGSGSDSDRAAVLQLQHVPTAVGLQAPVQVLLPGPASGGTSLEGLAGGGRWAAADVPYVFQGPLDLAVLKLRHAPGLPQQAQQAACCPLRLSRQPPRPGQPVLVAGFPAYSPRSSPLGGPVLTAGTLAKVVSLPGSGQPAMLLTSAAVHSGASGGAVVDACTGELLGLVTSNAKHSRRAGSGSGSSGGSSGHHRGGESGSGLSGDRGGPSSSSHVTVLPHLNFSIPAAQLAPVLLAASEAAAAEAAGGGAMGGGVAGDAAAVAAWRQLDTSGAADVGLNQVWRMDPRQRQRQQPQEAGRGGAFGGAAPPARLQRLLEQLAERQKQGQQGQQAQQGEQQPAANLRAKL